MVIDVISGQRCKTGIKLHRAERTERMRDLSRKTESFVHFVDAASIRESFEKRTKVTSCSSDVEARPEPVRVPFEMLCSRSRRLLRFSI